MLNVLLVVVLATAPRVFAAPMEPPAASQAAGAISPLPAILVSVHDGDTFTVDLPCELPTLCDRVPVRVAGIDTPELRGRCTQERVAAQRARALAKAKLDKASSIVLLRPERDKYFRVLSPVLVDGEDLGDALVRAGLARPYDGGTKAGWCEEVEGP